VAGVAANKVASRTPGHRTPVKGSNNTAFVVRDSSEPAETTSRTGAAKVDKTAAGVDAELPHL
jgi:hypothetical protein